MTYSVKKCETASSSCEDGESGRGGCLSQGRGDDALVNDGTVLEDFSETLGEHVSLPVDLGPWDDALLLTEACAAKAAFAFSSRNKRAESSL